MVRPSRFSPRSEPHEALEARTVCREVLCDTMVRGIGDAVRSGQARFDLVVGPRGAGKSHLMGLIEGRLRKDLEGHAIIVGLPEDFHPSSLLHLLAEILKALPPDPDVGPVERQLAILAGHPPEDARGRAVNMIRARLRDLSLVIVIENLDVVFMAIGRDGQHQLRSILQTERRWSIVATSRSRAPAFSKESEPFFGTFVVRVLEPLSAEGCREMLVRLARATGDEALAAELSTPKGLARVQTLRHVLGGYPRAMAFILPHLHHDRPDMVENALHELAEELTPYFQEQMNRLSPGQRPVAELLAEHWNPLSVSEIALATFASPTTISTHLRYLRGDAIVRCTKLGREHFYEISDPLFRIARAMKRDDLRAKTFLRVLQGWYELRGLDVWRLPPVTRAELCVPLEHDGGDYDDALFESMWEELERGHAVRLIEPASASNSPHSLRTAFQILALGLLGREEDAFSVLRSIGSLRILAVLVEVSVIQEELCRDDAPHHLQARARESLIGRFCAAAMAIYDGNAEARKAELSQAIDVLEQSLQSESVVIRSAATEAVLELTLPLALVYARHYDLCRRIVARLEPIASEALSFNLASIILYLWARDEIPQVFGSSPELLRSLSQGVRPLAKSVMTLLAYNGAAPPVIAEDVLSRLAQAIAEGQLHPDEYSPADWGWLAMFGVDLVRHSSVEHWLSRGMTLWSDDDRLWLANALHAGALYWIAAGRDLTPIVPALSLERLLTTSVGRESTLMESADPDASYVRLAAPERAAVRDIAKSLELDERYAALCALSPDEA